MLRIEDIVHQHFGKQSKQRIQEMRKIISDVDEAGKTMTVLSDFEALCLARIAESLEKVVPTTMLHVILHRCARVSRRNFAFDYEGSGFSINSIPLSAFERATPEVVKVSERKRWTDLGSGCHVVVMRERSGKTTLSKTADDDFVLVDIWEPTSPYESGFTYIGLIYALLFHNHVIVDGLKHLMRSASGTTMSLGIQSGFFDVLSQLSSMCCGTGRTLICMLNPSVIVRPSTIGGDTLKNVADAIAGQTTSVSTTEFVQSGNSPQIAVATSSRCWMDHGRDIVNYVVDVDNPSVATSHQLFDDLPDQLLNDNNMLNDSNHGFGKIDIRIQDPDDDEIVENEVLASLMNAPLDDLLG